LHVQDAEESINKAFSFFKQSRYEDAIAVCDSGLEMDARDSLLLHVLLQIKGASLVKQHKYNDGLQCIDRALEIDPTNPHCLELRNQVVRAYGPIEKSKAQARSSKPKVLVVDEPAIADTLVIILNQSGFDAVAVYTGTAAVECVHKARFDIIISEVIMPDMNGIEVAIRIRQSHPESKIVLWSGPNAAKRARLQGHEFEILDKPVPPQHLLAKLRTYTNSLGFEIQTQARILVVNDEESVRLSICQVLSSKGYQCCAAAGGLDAIRLLEHQEIDLVLHDLLNPQMDGISLLMSLREKFPDTPVVVVTAIDDVDAARACFQNGASGYVRLPLDIDQLLAAVRRALETRSRANS